MTNLCWRLSHQPQRAIWFVIFVTIGDLAFGQDDISAPIDLQKWVEKAEKSGSLTLDFYDPQKPPKPFPGWTDFDFRLTYRYEVKTDWKAAKNKSIQVNVRPTFTSIQPTVTHKVFLPRTIDRNDWYQTRLGSHELDHVAIGTHPRLLMLAKHVLNNTGSLSGTVNRASEITDKWVKDLVQGEANERQKAIYNLILKNNQQLDELTRHGGHVVPDRETYFQGLYLKENLDELKFPYLADTLKLLETAEYVSAKSIFEKP